MSQTLPFLLELFSEEIPSRMQARAAADLARLVAEATSALAPADIATFHGPRRIALTARLAPRTEARSSVERGPRESAPEQALAGFLRKHGVTKEALRVENGFWVLETSTPARAAAELLAETLPGLLWRFPWPKSMRWGGTSAFTWVRPLRHVLCMLDGSVVPFALALGSDDDGHGLASGDLTEGHRFLAPGTFAVDSIEGWREGLAARKVIVDPAERRAMVAGGVAKVAREAGLDVVEDEGLVDEVNGLVEYPVAMLGRIDDRFMDLPAEVMQVSMRVNQRYFALRRADGKAAPHFAFVANIAPRDGDNRLIVAGNERVLRARFSDARHFWDLDRAVPLADRVEALGRVTFHAKLGSQLERAHRLAALAGDLAPLLGADVAQATRAGLLAKADLSTGMVGEFPELQGVMGGYYARHDGEAEAVAEAIGSHYQPRGPSDPVPAAPVAIAVALADKLDTLAAFFAAGEKPTGSGDPYALRRAALGVLRIIRENGLSLPLSRLIGLAASHLPAGLAGSATLAELPGFLTERLRVALRGEGRRHDTLAAVLGAGEADDVVDLLARLEALEALLGTEDGANVLAAAKRAANILRIEAKKDGPFDGAVDPALFGLEAEQALDAALTRVAPELATARDAGDHVRAMTVLASLRGPLDAFFADVIVNADDPALRLNRLRLLHRLDMTMQKTADFSQITS